MHKEITLIQLKKSFNIMSQFLNQVLTITSRIGLSLRIVVLVTKQCLINFNEIPDLALL